MIFKKSVETCRSDTSENDNGKNLSIKNLQDEFLDFFILTKVANVILTKLRGKMGARRSNEQSFTLQVMDLVKIGKKPSNFAMSTVIPR